LQYRTNDRSATPADAPPLSGPGIDKAREKIRSAETRRKIAAGEFRLEDLDGVDTATVNETAAVLRADPRTIRKRIKDGVIPAAYIGEYRVPCAWLRQQAGVAA
jgi:hypothetical protein